MKRFLIRFLLLVTAGVSTSQADVYKWTDASGRIVYSDRPPMDRPSELVRVAPTRGVRTVQGAAAPAPANALPNATTFSTPQSAASPDSASSTATSANSPSSSASGGGGGGGGGSVGAQSNSGTNAGGGNKPQGATPASGLPTQQAAAAPQEAPSTPPRVVIDVAKLSFADTPIGPISSRYFGVHIHRSTKLPFWPGIPFGSWRLWDAGMDWNALEPERDKWNFAALDRIADLAQQNDVELLYTFGVTPTWASARPTEKFVYGLGGGSEPRNLGDWTDYVRAVATRYRGRIRNYELWNEPKFSELEKDAANGFFTGTSAKMFELGTSASTVLKQIDPQNILVSPGFAGDGQRDAYFFSQGGKPIKDAIDVVAHHLYANPPELIYKFVPVLKRQLAAVGAGQKPLWNTEGGYYLDPNTNSNNAERVNSEKLMAAYVSRTLVLGAAAGLERFFYYSLDGGPRGLIDPATGQANVSGVAYARTYRWLVGASINGCQTPDGVRWVCQLSRGSRKAWVVWSSSGEADFVAGGDSPAVEYESVTGMTVSVSGVAIPLGPSPVLVKTDSGAWSN